jgi:hypothetical protein
MRDELFSHHLRVTSLYEAEIAAKISIAGRSTLNGTSLSLRLIKTRPSEYSLIRVMVDPFTQTSPPPSSLEIGKRM